MCLFLLLLPLLTLLSACTYTPTEWQIHRNFATGKAQNETLCKVNWFQLLEVNVAHMRVKENQLWVVAAQQYIAASLNKLRFFTNTTNTTNTRMLISESILYLGNTLEYYCDNISLWTLQEKEDSVLQILSDFNHGLFPEYSACDDISIPNDTNSVVNGSRSEEDTFFYYQSIDTFIVRDYVNNETISKSEFIGLTNTNFSLSISMGLLVLWLFICFLKMVIDGNARKRYRLWKNRCTIPAEESVYIDEKDVALSMLSSDDKELL